MLCLWQMPVTEEHAADRAPHLLPLVPLRWVVDVSKIHMAYLLLPDVQRLSLRGPEATCGQLGLRAQTFLRDGAGSPSLSFTLSRKTKIRAYSF